MGSFKNRPPPKVRRVKSAPNVAPIIPSNPTHQWKQGPGNIRVSWGGQARVGGSTGTTYGRDLPKYRAGKQKGYSPSQPGTLKSYSSAEPWAKGDLPNTGGFPRAQGRRAGFGGVSSGVKRSGFVRLTVSATYRFGRVNPENTKFDHASFADVGKLLGKAFRRIGFTKDTAEWALYYFMQWFMLRLYYRTPLGPGIKQDGKVFDHLRDAWRMTIRTTTNMQIGFRLYNDMPYLSFVEFGTRRFEGRNMLGYTVAEARQRISMMISKIITPAWAEYVRKNTAAGRKATIDFPGGMQSGGVMTLSDIRNTFGLGEPFKSPVGVVTPRFVMQDVTNPSAWLLLALPDPNAFRTGKSAGGVTDYRSRPNDPMTGVHTSRITGTNRRTNTTHVAVPRRPNVLGPRRMNDARRNYNWFSPEGRAAPRAPKRKAVGARSIDQMRADARQRAEDLARELGGK